MKILIAGAGGQLGRSLVGVLSSHEAIALERTELDIADLAAVREAVRAHRPDLVINAAAYNRVDDAESDPASAYRVNAVGPRVLALVTAEKALPFVHVSTDYVFDGEAARPYHEFDRPNPVSVYGASKLAGEEAVRALNLRHYLVRCAWVYHEVGSNFPLTMLKQRERPEVRVVDDQVGSPTYAPHLAAAIAELVETGAFGTYHLAGSGSVSWFGLTRALYARLGISTPIVPVTTAEFLRPARRPRNSVLESIQEPRITLPPWEKGLEAFCEKVVLPSV